MTRNEGRNTYLDHVEHGDKLQEYEHYMSLLKKSSKALLEDHHLPTRVDKLLYRCEEWVQWGRGQGQEREQGWERVSAACRTQVPEKIKERSRNTP